MEFNGLPIHPLIVHAVVVFVPLSALAAIAFAIPRFRWIARWPALVLTLLATAASFVAIRSGEDLQKSRGIDTPLVHTHAEWGERLMLAMWVFAAVVIVAFVVLPYVTRLRDGADREARVPALATPVAGLMVLAAISVLVLAVLTGDAGAKAVWS